MLDILAIPRFPFKENVWLTFLFLLPTFVSMTVFYEAAKRIQLKMKWHLTSLLTGVEIWQNCKYEKRYSEYILYLIKSFDSFFFFYKSKD
jgi:hypothetical protein